MPFLKSFPIPGNPVRRSLEERPQADSRQLKIMLAPRRTRGYPLPPTRTHTLSTMSQDHFLRPVSEQLAVSEEQAAVLRASVDRGRRGYYQHWFWLGWGKRGPSCTFSERFTVIGSGPDLSSLDPLTLLVDNEWQGKRQPVALCANPHADPFLRPQWSQTPFRPVGAGPQRGQAPFRRGHTAEAWTAPVSIAVGLSANERPL